MAKAGARKVAKYGERFKATAVKLSSLPGVRVKDVAAALDIHAFMLSLWKKQVRQGVIVARASKLDVETTAELRRPRELERPYKVLKEEHEPLKKAHPVCFRSILLKNSFFTDDGKILGVIRRDARFRLGGYMKELTSRCRTY